MEGEAAGVHGRGAIKMGQVKIKEATEADGSLGYVGLKGHQAKEVQTGNHKQAQIGMARR